MTKTVDDGLLARPVHLLDGQERPTFVPVKVFAALGGLILAFEAYLVVAWVASGDFRPTPVGPDTPPQWMDAAMIAFEILSIVMLLVVLYAFLIRPWRNDGRMSLDGILVLTFLLMLWQDPLVSYSVPWYTLNAGFPTNFGSWLGHVPGVLTPNARNVVEPFWNLATYAYVMLPMVMLANWVQRRAKARWPRLGPAGLLFGTYAGYLGLILAAESLFMRLGFYAFPGAIEGLTLFHGRYYQFPVYEALFGAIPFTVWSAIRLYRDDHGRTIAERGIQTLSVGRRAVGGIRFLAVMGLFQIVFLVGYIIPQNLLSFHASTWPAEFDHRSYLRNGLCGQGTDYACPGPGIPINRPGSGHVRPDGSYAPGAEHGSP